MCLCRRRLKEYITGTLSLFHRFCERWNSALSLNTVAIAAIAANSNVCCTNLPHWTALNRNSHPMWYQRKVFFFLLCHLFPLSLLLSSSFFFFGKVFYAFYIFSHFSNFFFFGLKQFSQSWALLTANDPDIWGMGPTPTNIQSPKKAKSINL